MFFLQQADEKAQEERDQEVADVQAVHIGVRGHHHPRVAQAVHRFLDVQAAHQVVHFRVLVKRVAVQVADVQGFAR